MSLHICVLEADVIHPGLVERYKGYGEMFRQLLARQPLDVEVSVYNVMQGQYPQDDRRFDAYLISGSKADSFSSEPWVERLKTYVLKLYQRGEKLLGICFGHQLLALVLGGDVRRASKGWGVGVHRYRLLEKPQWMSPRLDELSLLISHQDQVTRLPANATLIASSDFCPFAVYQVGDRVLCFQGHPEFVPEYSRALLDNRRQALGEEVYQQAVATLEQPHQGDIAAEWLMRFVAQDSALESSVRQRQAVV